MWSSRWGITTKANKALQLMGGRCGLYQCCQVAAVFGWSGASLPTPTAPELRSSGLTNLSVRLWGATGIITRSNNPRGNS